MIELGKMNELTVLRQSEAGVFLGDKEGNEVLLPKSRQESAGDYKGKLKVFVYTDSEARSIASLRKPVVQINQFALLRVNALTTAGAFMDWGLEKDLFVPHSEQKNAFEEGKYYVVHVYLDNISGRITGSNKLDKFLIADDVKLEGGAEVDILIIEESPLGFSCIINGLYKGLIYHNEVYQDLFIGDELGAYVKTIRPDGLIDISLQKSGFKNVLSATEIVMDYLENNKGFLNLHDKSSPEEIAAKFSMSKATFKKAIGILYRHRKVLIKPDGVYLVTGEAQTEISDEE